MKAIKKDQTWVQKNKTKPIKSIVEKDTILEAVELLFLRKTHSEESPLKDSIQHIKIQLKLEQMMSQEAFTRMFDPIVNDQEFQNSFIKALLESRFYKESVSELIFINIRGFLLDDNFFTQKIPILGKLFKIGQNVANNTITRNPEILENLEIEIRKFIERNLRRVDDLTKTMIKQSITPGNINNIANFAWDNFKDQYLIIDTEFFPKTLNKNQLYLQILDSMIESFIHAYGNRKLADFLANP